MSQCVWTASCPQTGAASVLSFDVGTATWTLTHGGSTYTYTQESTDAQFCNSITLMRSSGTEGPTGITVTGLKVNASGPQPNCCNAIGLPQTPPHHAAPSFITLTVSDQTGAATCIGAGPFSGSSSGVPILASWIIGNGTTGPCEGEETFIVSDNGGCVLGYFGNSSTIIVTLVNSPQPTDNPYVLVYDVSFPAGTIGAASGTATFTVSIPNP